LFVYGKGDVRDVEGDYDKGGNNGGYNHHPSAEGEMKHLKKYYDGYDDKCHNDFSSKCMVL
jgi:hypothetical protein